MKYLRTITYTACAAFLLLATSCEDFLEVNPQTQIPSADALRSGRNVESVLISAYSDMVGGNVLGQRIQLYNELLSDNIALNEITISPTDFTGQVALRNTNVLNKDVDDLWSFAYRSIARANAVIHAVDNGLITDGTTPSIQQRYKAEALFIRGVMHFELVRLFGKPYSSNPSTDLGIPIRTSYLTADDKQPRATVAAVYAQVVSDLQGAAGILPVNNGNRATVWAAKGYLARIYFNMLDYQNAYTTADDIIDNAGFSFGTDPFLAFRNIGNVQANGGVIFQIVNGGNPFGGFRAQSNQYSISQGLNGLLSVLEQSGAGDYRADVALQNNRAYSAKWNADVINPPIIRLAEIYLIHAESAANLSSTNASLLNDAAISYNQVRGSAVSGYQPVSFASQQDALTSIQRERRIELLFEGDRIHELKRLRSENFGEIRSGNTVLRPAVNYNDASLLLKIPVSETSGNPLIVQN